VNYDGTSRGLHGGTWSYSGNRHVVFRLENVRLVPGVRVTGTAHWHRYRGPVTAEVEVRGARGLSGTVRVRWNAHKQLDRARLRGRIGGRALRATMLAP
jgi:hypothetical protein